MKPCAAGEMRGAGAARRPSPSAVTAVHDITAERGIAQQRQATGTSVPWSYAQDELGEALRRVARIDCEGGRHPSDRRGEDEVLHLPHPEFRERWGDTPWEPLLFIITAFPRRAAPIFDHTGCPLSGPRAWIRTPRQDVRWEGRACDAAECRVHRGHPNRGHRDPRLSRPRQLNARSSADDAPPGYRTEPRAGAAASRPPHRTPLLSPSRSSAMSAASS